MLPELYRHAFTCSMSGYFWLTYQKVIHIWYTVLVLAACTMHLFQFVMLLLPDGTKLSLLCVVLILTVCTSHSFPEMCQYKQTVPGILTSDIPGCTRYPLLALTALITYSLLAHFVGFGSLYQTFISFPELWWCYQNVPDNRFEFPSLQQTLLFVQAA